MPGLIPLMLNPVAAGNRSSVIYTPSKQHQQHQQHQQQRHARSQSANGPSKPVHAPSPSPANSSLRRASFPVVFAPKPIKPAKPTKPAKRAPAAAPAPIPVMPYTSDDWRRAVSEAKRQNINRQYRACFTRCTEILNYAKNLDVEPVYLISLHFYAATAMEMCARPLTAPSSYRDWLLQEARSHYDQASELVQTAEVSALTKHRMSFILSPTLGPHSESMSMSMNSRLWSSGPGFSSSPAPSECSSEDLNARFCQSPLPTSPSILLSPTSRSPSPHPATTTKMVSFDLPKPSPSTPRLEPYIRPDSPTLGFDDEYFLTGFARQDLPEIPVRAKSPEPVMLRMEEETNSRPSSRMFYQNHHHMNCDTPSDGSVSSRRSSFGTNVPSSRYCAHLAGLKTQLARHRAYLDNLLAKQPTEDEAAFDNFSRCSTPANEYYQPLDRRARIEHLRKRKRFDPSRYEALREAALAELD